jgi:hypothetical protein
MPLGRWPDVTISEARKRKGAIVVSISDGEDPWQKRAEERRRKPDITLNDAFAEWLKTAADQKRSRDQDELRYAMNIRGGHQFMLGKWKVKLPRFRGHPSICVAGVHSGKKETTLHAGVPASDDRAGSVRAKPGEPGEGVRADGASDPELGRAG